MEEQYVMGLDSGTTCCKVIVVDRDGNVVGEGNRPHEPFFSSQPKWAEQHASDWWAKFCEASRVALADRRTSLGKIVAIGITTQRGTIVHVDQDGKELRPAICWIDRRPAPKFMWVKDKEPDIWKKTCKVLGPQGWFVHKLTGEWRDSIASSFVNLPEFETWDWHNRQEVRALIPEEKLPEFDFPGEVLGHVTRDAARESGLPEGLPVVGGCGDKPSGTIGSGCVGRENLAVSYGTALSLGATSQTRPQPPLIARLSGIPGAYNAEMGLSGGFWTCTWFSNQFGDLEAEAARKRGVSILAVLGEKAAEVPAGSQGLVVQPYWWGREWSVYDPAATGTVIGWIGAHTRAHFYRAILEGLVQEARYLKECMAKGLKTDFTDIRIIGGGSTSDLVMQITADVFGGEVSRTQTSSVEALGAAMHAAKGGGIHKTVEEAAANMSHVVKKFKPNPTNVELYSRIYEKVLMELYPATEKIQSELRKIAGSGSGAQ